MASTSPASSSTLLHTLPTDACMSKIKTSHPCAVVRLTPGTSERAAGVHGVHNIQAKTHPATPHARAQVAACSTDLGYPNGQNTSINKWISSHAPPKFTRLLRSASRTQGSLWHRRGKKTIKPHNTESRAASCFPSNVNVHHVRVPPVSSPSPNGIHIRVCTLYTCTPKSFLGSVGTKRRGCWNTRARVDMKRQDKRLARTQRENPTPPPPPERIAVVDRSRCCLVLLYFYFKQQPNTKHDRPSVPPPLDCDKSTKNYHFDAQQQEYRATPEEHFS